MDVRLLASMVYDKPAGDVRQELGGVATTLLGCADACGEVLSQCAERELRRIETLPAEKFRRRQKQNAKDGIGAPATAPSSSERSTPEP